jgi:hypothetical protein
MMLFRARLTSSRSFSAESLLSADGLLSGQVRLASFVHHDVPFVVRAGEIPQLGWFTAARDAIQRRVGNQGMGAITDIVTDITGLADAPTAQQVIQVVAWSDAWQVIERQWIVPLNPAVRNPLLNRIRKVLSVASGIALTSLHTQLWRDSRPNRAMDVSCEGLRAFARWHPDLEVDTLDRISSSRPVSIDETLSDSELILYRTLRLAEVPMSHAALVDVFAREGFSLPTASVDLRCSPIVVKVARDAYRLIASGDHLASPEDSGSEASHAVAQEASFAGNADRNVPVGAVHEDLPLACSENEVGSSPDRFHAEVARTFETLPEPMARALAEDSASSAESTGMATTNSTPVVRPQSTPEALSDADPAIAGSASDAWNEVPLVAPATALDAGRSVTVVAEVLQGLVEKDGCVHREAVGRAVRQQIGTLTGTSLRELLSQIPAVVWLDDDWLTSFDARWHNPLPRRIEVLERQGRRATARTLQSAKQGESPPNRVLRLYLECFERLREAVRPAIALEARWKQAIAASPAPSLPSAVGRRGATSPTLRERSHGHDEAEPRTSTENPIDHLLGEHEDDFPETIEGTIQRIVAHTGLAEMGDIHSRFREQPRALVDEAVARLTAGDYTIIEGHCLTTFDPRYHNRLTHRLRRLMAVFPHGCEIEQARNLLARDKRTEIGPYTLMLFARHHPEFTVENGRIDGMGSYRLNDPSLFWDGELELQRIFAGAKRSMLARAEILDRHNDAHCTLDNLEYQLAHSVIIHEDGNDRFSIIDPRIIQEYQPPKTKRARPGRPGSQAAPSSTRYARRGDGRDGRLPSPGSLARPSGQQAPPLDNAPDSAPGAESTLQPSVFLPGNLVTKAAELENEAPSSASSVTDSSFGGLPIGALALFGQTTAQAPLPLASTDSDALAESGPIGSLIHPIDHLEEAGGRDARAMTAVTELEALEGNGYGRRFLDALVVPETAIAYERAASRLGHHVDELYAAFDLIPPDIVYWLRGNADRSRLVRSLMRDNPEENEG